VSFEPITLDAMQGFIAPIHVRKILTELTRQLQDRPDRAQCHPIQRICVQNTATSVGPVDGKLALEGKPLREYPMTLGGIPLKSEKTMPDDVIEFYCGNQFVAKIFNLAKPPGL
jgi:hypothetical protein